MWSANHVESYGSTHAQSERRSTSFPLVTPMAEKRVGQDKMSWAFGIIPPNYYSDDKYKVVLWTTCKILYRVF